MSTLKPYSDFWIAFRWLLYRSLPFNVQSSTLFVNTARIWTEGITAKAAENSNSGQHRRCRSQQNLKQIDKFP